MTVKAMASNAAGFAILDGPIEPAQTCMLVCAELAMSIPPAVFKFMFWVCVQPAMMQRPHFHENRFFICGLDHSFQPRIACFHALFHAGRQHRSPRLRVGQCHPDRHQRAFAIRVERGLDAVIRGAIREVHSLHMHDTAGRLQFEIFARQVKPLAFGVAPLVADLATGSRLAHANGHRPALRAKQPFLDQYGRGTQPREALRIAWLQRCEYRPQFEASACSCFSPSSILCFFLAG